jgi:hypothetical protein
MFSLPTGKMQDRIVCAAGHVSARPDTFLDLPLVIRSFDGRKCASVEESLDLFTEDEKMDGDNQYRCDTCGELVDATKGLRITRLPPVLTLQLKRFDFDWNVERRIKINDRMAFPLQLDATGHVLDEEEAAAAGTGPNKDDAGTEGKGKSHLYDLFSVLVHSGSALGGHYYAYVRDPSTDMWHNFNDSTVSPITTDELQATFGGDACAPDPNWAKVGAAATTSDNDAETAGSSDADADDEKSSPPTATTSYSLSSATSLYGSRSYGRSSWGTSSANAYMLVYRRAGQPVPAPISREEVPEDLLAEIDADNDAIAVEAERARRSQDAVVLRAARHQDVFQAAGDPMRQPSPDGAWGAPRFIDVTTYRSESVRAATDAVFKALGGEEGVGAKREEVRTDPRADPPFYLFIYLFILLYVDGRSFVAIYVLYFFYNNSPFFFFFFFFFHFF